MRASGVHLFAAAAALLWLGAHEAAAAPVVGVSPATMPHVTLEQDGVTAQTLTVHNGGDALLTFDLRIASGSEARPGGEEVIAIEGETPNDTDPTEDPSLAPYAEYSGNHLHFGISAYGEIMPYQYPVGTEHLRNGVYVAGYTLAYRSGGSDRIAYAGYAYRSSLTPVSYEELENTASRLRVRVVTQTTDGALRVARTFAFVKSSKHVEIETAIQNVSGSEIGDLVLKSFADWDVEGGASYDIFDSDDDSNLLYAFQTHYCGIASDRSPDFQDLSGWDDYGRRSTNEDYRSGPVSIDGLVVLHFELGSLPAGASEKVGTSYVSGDSLDELKGEIGFSRWLRSDVVSGVVAPGGSQEIVLTYDARDLEIGEYAAEIVLTTNDALSPEVAVPASLTVLPDATPPAAVDDLAASEPTPTSVRLDWSAVADNGALGKPAASYDVRTSTSPITEATWDDATPVEGEPIPGSPGSPESMVVSGLLPETLHYFALKVADDIGLLSPLSNVASVETLIGPIFGVDPDAMPHVTLEQDGVTAQALTVHNGGDALLTFDLRIASGSEALPGGEEVIAVEGETPNDTDPTEDPSLAPYAEYSGDHLHFGISAYGEIMPYQYPVGTEHLKAGIYVSGYTLAYRSGGSDRIAYAAYAYRSSLTPVSYEELENTASRLRVRVVTQTTDGALRVARTFDFAKSSKHVAIETAIQNVSGSEIGDLVLKPFADWDVDGGSLSDTFDSDDASNLLYAFQTHYCGIASDRSPDFQDLDGWDDYRRRSTDEDYRSGPVSIDGLVVLHFELGSLPAGASEKVGTSYVSGDSLDELKGEIGFSRWLKSDVVSGVVAPGGSQEIVLTYDARDLEIGEYAAEIVLTTNDALSPEVAVPASLTVLPDATPPAAVDDLAASEPTPTSVRLEWSAVADNGALGKPAASYDVRTSTSPITEATWDDATPVEGEPIPGSPGSPESMVVSGLLPETFHYFALKVADDIGLLSPLSNVASVETLVPPDLMVDPVSITDELPEGETATHSLDLSNVGGYPLFYEVSVEETSAPVSVSATTSRSASPPSGSVTAADLDEAEYVPGEILVRFVPGLKAARATDARGRAGAKLKRRISKLGVELWELPSKARSAMLDNLNVLSKNPNVLYAQPNYIVHAMEAPSDPGFDDLWGLHNTGQTGGIEDADIDALEAWEVTTGSENVVVAVIDTGVDYTHPDLAENMWVNVDEIPGNGVDDDANGFVDDVYGYDFAYGDSNPMDVHSHGTHCAGTIGAVGNNGIGVVGVNHDVAIMAVKFLDDFGFGSTDDAIESILYAVDNGATILSNSWGGTSYSSALEDAIVYALDHDVLFVAAAGNDYWDTDLYPNYPSCHDVDNVLSIAATDDRDSKAGFSNWGSTTVDLGAPGVAILSTAPGGRYSYKQGTSMATPHVAGAAALLKAYDPSLSALDLKKLLMKSVDPVESLAGRTVTGGRLNVANALTLAGPDWMRLEGELSGHIPAGFSKHLLVELDATGRIAGDYGAEIAIESTDPDTPVTVVPVEMKVLFDCCPPDAIDDLAATDVSSSHVSLSWSAVGDDGLIGRASEYDLRYSTEPITEDSWDGTTPALGEPVPSEPGSIESFDLTGLEPATPYWIGIKTRDNSGQFSDLSNALAITTLVPPTIVVSPAAAMPHVSLKPGGTTTRSMTIANAGQEDLTFDLRIASGSEALRGGEEVIAIQGETPNDTDPTEDPSLAPYAEYSGDHLHFGISAYGEIMPYQYPVGTEHLTWGIDLAGYTLAYRSGGIDRVAYAGYAYRSYLTPVSYEELENTASRLRVRVVTQTTDGALRIARIFDFAKSSKHVAIETAIQNVSGSEIGDLVLKSFADWDVDGRSSSNTFDSDDDSNLLYAFQTHYCGIASDRSPDFQDLSGWDDFTRRLTDEDYRSGPVSIDGVVVLHFELGSLPAGASEKVGTSYVSGDTLEELEAEIGFARWLTSDVVSGVVAPGGTQDVVLTYDATALEAGEYTADIRITTNDPVNLEVGLRATLSVSNPPIADAGGPYVTDEGTAVSFDGGGSTDPDGDELEYRWDYDNDGSWDSAWSDSPTASFTWNDDRLGTVRIAVSDGHFTDEDTASVAVVNVPPTAYDRAAATDEDVPVAVTLMASDPGADSLVFFVASGPSNGTLSGAAPNLIYAPIADYNGADSFTYFVHDGAAVSNPATVAIAIAPVNDPPACMDDLATTDEDVAATIAVTSNDSGGPPDEDQALTVVEVVGAAHGSAAIDGGGTVTYTPDPDFFGSDAFSYTIVDGEGLEDSCAVNVAIDPVNDRPAASVDVATQTLQYSDGIAPVIISASDIDSPTLTPDVDLPEGLVLGEGDCTPVGIGVECAWQLTGRALMAAGSHDIAIAVDDGELRGHTGFALVVEREDAGVIFSPENEVAMEVAAPGGNSGGFSYVVDLIETVPDAAGNAAHAGDIGLATASMTLEPVGPGNPYTGDCSVTVMTGEGYDAATNVACSFDDVEVNTYAVQVTIEGDHYTGAGEDALTIFDPSLGFVTGGGWFYWPGTDDAGSGYPGHRTNFGTVMKYNKGGAGLHGNFVMVLHLPDGTHRRVKSNALAGLAVGEVDEVDDSFGWASFTGKATYRESCDDDGGGNHRFSVYVEERGTAHAGNDRFWVQVEDKHGVALPGLWMGLPAPENAVEIEGGNIFVPHTRSDHDSDGVESLDDNCPGTPNPDQADVDGDREGNACDDDDDDDGLSDAFELANGFDPLVAGEEGLDNDGDGLDNLAEQAAGTDPNAVDSDGDGFGDGEEIAGNSDPNDPGSSPEGEAIPALPEWGLLLLVFLALLAAGRVWLRPTAT